VVSGRDWSVPIEAETVIDDAQALKRRLALKARDGGASVVILLVADTHRNRRAMRTARDEFSDLPLGMRDTLAALKDGRRPLASGIVML